MRGVVDYSPHPTVAILDSERPGETHKGIPVVGSVADALPYEPTTALVGVATQGGRFPPAWRELLKDSIAGGPRRRERPARVHLRRRRAGRARGAATASSSATCASRRADLNVPTGENLELDAKTVLTVGSDCAIGKKTVAIELDREARRARPRSRSSSRPARRASRSPAGASPSTRSSPTSSPGAAERLVVEGAERGGELLFVEGQGSLSHPAYSGVTLGLMHGSAPHAYVLCHVAGATEIEGYPGYPLPPLPRDRRAARARLAAARARPASRRSRSTRATSATTRRAPQLAAVEEETGLPTDDPVRFGAARFWTPS